MKKKFYIVKHINKYNGERYFRPSVYKRFATREEAEQKAAEMNKSWGKEACEKMYRSWVADETKAFATEEWYERMKESQFYCFYEVKESK